MNNLESKKNNIKKIFRILIIVILIIFILKIVFLNNLIHKQKNDDFLFLRFLSNSHINNETNIKEQEEYKFKVSYQEIDSKIINLKKIIAPGTSEEFDVLLNSNQDLKYRIQFISLSEKPKNLKFLALINEKEIAKADTLEELSKSIKGVIKENEEIKVKIKYYWDYEGKTEEDNIQDTIDSKNIKEYEFNIYVIGEEID